MKYLLFGHGSFKNKGCQALVKTISKQIYENDKNAFIVLASFDKLNDEKYNVVDKVINHSIEHCLSSHDKKNVEKYKESNDFEALTTLYQKEVLNEIENVDVCLSIGGDNYSEGYVEYLHQINARAKKLNKKTVLFGASLYENIDDQKLIEDLKLFDLIFSRETFTTNALAKFIDSTKLIQLPDTAFSLLPDKCNVYKLIENDYIAINVSDIIVSNNENTLDYLYKLIEYMLKKYNKKIVLFPHVYLSYWNDYLTVKKIKDMYSTEERVVLIGDSELECDQIKYILSKAYLVIAARTHASIAAYSTCVPTLVLGYSLKSKGIAYDLFENVEDYVIPFKELTFENLKMKIDKMVFNYDSIRERLQKIMPDYINQSSKVVKTMMDRLYEQNLYPCDFKDCVGCQNCKNLCPQGAIEMVEDKKGFLHPHINMKKCIKCGKCKNVCPINSSVQYKYNKKCFACFNNNEEILNNSSSGGVFYLLSKLVLDKKGVVFGVSLVENKAMHICVDNMADLSKIMKAKYIQSDTSNTFAIAKNYLDSGKFVLFSGTPCQISALYSFLEKKYENLLTISVVCHGVPSSKILNVYLDELSIGNNKVVNVDFRNKNKGWRDYDIEYTFSSGYKQIISHENDNFMYAFINNLILRDSCYNCPFHVGEKNNADIIIGDYWGIENVYPTISNNKGVSCVIVNSTKGEEEFNKVIPFITYKNSSLNNISKYNSCVSKSVNYDEKVVDDFWENIVIGFNKSINKLKEINSLKNSLIQKDEQINNQQLLITQKDTLIEENNEENQKLREDIESLCRNNQELIKEMNNIVNSKSWKVTKPLRYVARKVKKHE